MEIKLISLIFFSTLQNFLIYQSLPFFYISNLMLEEDSQVYQCNITIKEIKLTVKFPCKLTLNHQNKIIKADVTSDSNGKYIIEREVKTKSENQQPVEILIHLTTEKGGNIMAGIIKLNPKDLASSEGQSLTVGLQKCLDQTASCLLKVQRVWLTKTNKAKSLMGEISPRNRKNYGDELLGSSKKLPPTVVDNYRNVETRSELPGFNMKKPSVLRKDFGFDGPNQANKFYGLGPKSYVPEVNVGKSKNIDRSIELRRDGKFRIDDDNKTVGKREVDPSYRLTVEANEKNLKMDIMKYKMKAEEQEKTIEEKNKQIKALKQQVSQLHRQSVEKGFYQEEINSKNVMIQKLQDTNKSLNKQNSRLESRIIELERAVEQGKSNLHSGLQRAKDQKQRKQTELNKQINMKKDQITMLNDQLRSKNNQMSRIKKIIQDLEKSLQAKTFDHEKSLQTQRAQMAKLQVLLNDKIRQLQHINKSGAAQRQSLQSQLKKKTQQIQKLQTNTNHLMAEIKQLTELQRYYASYKQKHSELQKVFQKLQQQKKQVQKHYLKLMETKQKDYGQFKQEQSGLLNSYKKKNVELTQKNKQQTARIHQLQNKITILVSDMDKLKRSLELAQKELSTLTENCKLLNHSIKQKDQILLNKQKELSELESKLVTKQTLMKKDIEYKTQQGTKLSSRLSQLEHLFRQQKQNNQTLRFDATKIQGKNKLQEEIISRLNRQIDQLKSTLQKRQFQYKDELKELTDKNHCYELSQKKLNKIITDHEIQDLNNKNQINKLNKQVQILKDKLQRQNKKYQELQLALKQLNQINLKLQQNLMLANQELKELQNSNKALEADFSKTQKIKTIIVEEKTSAQNELQNLKKDVEMRINQEQSLNKEIKQLKEELNKAIIKANNSSKDLETFKQKLYTTIQSSFFGSNNNGYNVNSWIKKSFNLISESTSSKGHQRYSSSSNFQQTYLSRGTENKRLHESEVLSLNNQRSSSVYEPRFNQIIECYGRQSQQTIFQLNETVRKQKLQIQRLQRQSASLSSRLQSTQEESSNLVRQLQLELQKMAKNHQQQKSLLQERLMVSQRGNRQKQQVIEELNQELQMINHQLAANARTHQIQLQQLALKIQQLKSKLYDLQAKNDFSAMTILSNEEKIFLLQTNLSQTEEQLQFEKAKVQRKDKLIIQHTAKIDQLHKFLQQIKSQKLAISRQLFTTKERLDAEKQSNNKHKKMLQQQQQKNKEIKGLTNNLIKEKQTIVKNQIIKSQKVIELQDIISKYKIEKDQLITQNSAKQNILSSLKNDIKKHLLAIKELQQSLEHEQHQKLKAIENIKQKDKKIQEKQLQVKNLQINLQKILAKYDQDTNKLNQQHEETIKKFTKELDEKKTNVLELTNQMEKLKHLQKKLSEQNISLQQQIFFQKQTNSLANSRFDHMNRDIEGLQTKLSHALREIDVLNQEIRDRQEKLFELSNKLFSLENKLEVKESQMRQRLQKLDIDWKNKFQQTLEDYQAKIQSYEREKYYFKQKLQQQLEQISKLQQEKRSLMMEDQADKKIYQDKIKKIQSERLSLLQQKNKQLDKLRVQIQQIEQKLKQTKHQKDIKQDDIRRLQQKLKDKEQRLTTQQDKHHQSITQLQKQLQFQKKKQSQIKKFKQTIKNNLWSSQREIKRILQSYIKNLIGLCQQDKKNTIIDVMKNVETQIVKAIEINLEEV